MMYTCVGKFNNISYRVAVISLILKGNDIKQNNKKNQTKQTNKPKGHCKWQHQSITPSWKYL